MSGFPRGRLWQLTRQFTARSRAKRFELFIELMRPRASESILDVGVTDSPWRSGNPLESRYEHLEQVTAVALGESPSFREQFPAIELVIADGRSLPFPDGAFDIGFSNAVVEHVGGRDDQRRFVHELVRTCQRVMIATPNAAFPVDPHTLLPFVHWLPRRPRNRILQATGNAQWATEESLNPLTAGQLRSLFPADASVRIERQRVLGMTTVLIAVVE